MTAGEEIAGRGRSKKDRDWFMDASDTLQPLIDANNATLNQFYRCRVCRLRKSSEDIKGLSRMLFMMPRSSGSIKLLMKLRRPAADVLILLGDFNSRVGSSRGNNDLWQDIRGKHGVGEQLSQCRASHPP